jgi:hypothetical protein
MAETAPMTTYAPSKKKKKKAIKTALSGGGYRVKKKPRTGGTKHVVASEGGSL